MDNLETQKDPDPLCCSWLSLGSATWISHERNSHWDNKVLKKKVPHASTVVVSLGWFQLDNDVPETLLCKVSARFLQMILKWLATLLVVHCVHLQCASSKCAHEHHQASARETTYSWAGPLLKSHKFSEPPSEVLTLLSSKVNHYITHLRTINYSKQT